MTNELQLPTLIAYTLPNVNRARACATSLQQAGYQVHMLKVGRKLPANFRFDIVLTFVEEKQPADQVLPWYQYLMMHMTSPDNDDPNQLENSIVEMVHEFLPAKAEAPKVKPRPKSKKQKKVNDGLPAETD